MSAGSRAQSSSSVEKTPEILTGLQPQNSACFEAPFAIKTLNRSCTRELAQKEIDNLKRFDGQKHRQRLIQLLCSFEYQERFHLIFPWADANLLQFWQERSPPRGCGPSRWMAAEMLGLARGLYLIHNSPPRDSTDERTRGRHGDIKPKNILWFSAENDPDLCVPRGGNWTMDKTSQPSGILKICDFGLTDFRRIASVSKVEANSIGMTETYCAPECVSQSAISQSYDLWSLGCVLLEFVTWYAQGWQGVQEFNDRRAPARMFRGVEVREDMFFHLEFNKQVRMKSAVTEVSSSS